MLKILMVKTSSLGDVVHNFPAITDIRRRLPNVRIDWAVEEAYAPLVALHPGVDEVIPVALRRWRKSMFRQHTWRELGALRTQLQGRRYDRIIDAQGLAKSALVGRLASGPHVGFSKDTVREKIAARFYDTTYHVPRGRHAVERNRMLAAFALGFSFSGPPDYGLNSARFQSGDRGGNQGGKRVDPYVVLLHGTARAKKQWPERDWCRLAEFLGVCGLRVLVPWGTGAEQARSQRIAAAVVGATIPARAPLDDVARMIAGARAVVGVDTGLLHLAVAFEVPTVAIFTTTNPVLTGPVGSGPIAICDGKGRAPSLDEVQRALIDVLEHDRP